METSRLPRVLIVSNNALSLTESNGKTLESFFTDYKSDDICQLFFSEEQPVSDVCESFYSITEYDVLLKKNKKVGKAVSNKKEINLIRKNNKDKLSIIPKNNVTRLIRELIWKNNRWKNVEMINWIKTNDPEVIFFCAGDSAFAYDVVNYIIDATNAKLVTYITDDYILPYFNLSPFYWLRRNMIFSRMKGIVEKSSVFLTISKSMQNTYKEIFNKDSIVVSNMATKNKTIERNCNNNSVIKLIYAGGLQYGRYEVVSKVAKAIKRYNAKTNKEKAFLEIYCNSKPKQNILRKINVKNASEYYGSLDQDELINKLNDCDIPLFVESFKKRYIYKTKLSYSTKISEYMALGKSILVVGPKCVESVNFLNDYAYCINDLELLDEMLSKLLDKKELRIQLGIEAENGYIIHHDSNKTKNEIMNLLKTLIS